MFSSKVWRAVSITDHRAGRFAFDVGDPFVAHVAVPRPAVAEGLAEVAVLVEGRISRDQVDALAADAAQEGQVVALVKAAVGEIETGHGRQIVAPI